MAGKAPSMTRVTADTNKKISAAAGGQCLMVLAKAPERGKVKTRLARDIGKDAAAGLYRAFVSDLLRMLSRTPYPVFIHFWPPAAGSRMRDWLGPGYELIPQSGGDLGERMAAAFSRAFAGDFRQAVLIGSDLPDLPASLIHDAFAALTKTPAVIGPSEDGGYFLVGFNRDAFLPAVFSGVNWGSSTVLSETAALFEKNQVPVSYLRQWGDIDTRADLLQLARRVAAAPGPTAVETLNFMRDRGFITP